MVALVGAISVAKECKTEGTTTHCISKWLNVDELLTKAVTMFSNTELNGPACVEKFAALEHIRDGVLAGFERTCTVEFFARLESVVDANESVAFDNTHYVFMTVAQLPGISKIIHPIVSSATVDIAALVKVYDNRAIWRLNVMTTLSTYLPTSTLDVLAAQSLLRELASANFHDAIVHAQTRPQPADVDENIRPIICGVADKVKAWFDNMLRVTADLARAHVKKAYAPDSPLLNLVTA